MPGEENNNQNQNANANADADANANVNQNQNQEANNIEEEVVPLKASAYNALLDRLDELEAIAIGVASNQSAKPVNVDDLANSGSARPAGGRQLTEQDLENMKPAQIIQLVTEHINEISIRPLLVKIEEMNVRRELDDIMKDPKNADFDSLKGEIYEIASKNPSLSLKQALVLARERKGANQSSSSSNDTTNQLRNLPPRRNIPGGERPNNAARAANSEKLPETRKEAASQVVEELIKAGKITR